MNKYKTLTSNIVFLLFSQFCTKLIGYFLVPLYTKYLTTQEYGIYDLSVTTINLLIPILTLNIGESVLRFVLDKENNSRNVLTISTKYLLIGSLLLYFLLLINLHFEIIPGINPFWYYILILFFLSSLNTNVLYYAKGIGKLKVGAISSILGSLVTVALNIYLLTVMKLGLTGYYLATISGIAVQTVVLYFLCSCYKKIRLADLHNLEKEMKTYSTPLIVNSLAWWVNNSADRYIITGFCGVSDTGIYSVGYKIPSILNVVQSVFNQAWSVSSVTEFDSNDKESFFSNTYGLLNCALTITCSIIILLTKVLARFLYSNDFYAAWKYVPFLTISIVFGSLSGFFGGVFTAVKDTKILAKTTFVGAVINILFNIVLIKIMGPLGASISTALSFFVVWLIRLLYINKYISLKIAIVKDVISYSILCAQSLLIIFIQSNYSYLIVSVLLFVIILIYQKTLASFFNSIRKWLNETRSNHLVRK